MKSWPAEQARPIPGDIDYEQIAGLRRETRQKLAAARPDSIGKAGRVRGITPDGPLDYFHLVRKEPVIIYADSPEHSVV